MRAIKNYEVWKCTTDTIEVCEDPVLVEYLLSIYINGQLIVKLLCIPEALEELTIGYCYTEGFITAYNQIEALKVDVSAKKVEVSLKSQLEESYESKLAVTTESGDFPSALVANESLKALKPIAWEISTVIEKASCFLETSSLFKQTGNVHSVQLCKNGEVKYFYEDIGRFNALDKVVGSALKEGADLSQLTVYMSGRLPSSMAKKVIRAGIPIAVSRSAPTDVTLELAETYGLTVVGFARQGRLNIYNHYK